MQTHNEDFSDSIARRIATQWTGGTPPALRKLVATADSLRSGVVFRREDVRAKLRDQGAHAQEIIDDIQAELQEKMRSADRPRQR